MYDLHEPSVFIKALKTLSKKYPNSKKRIRKTVDSLKKDPEQGVLYPGFGNLFVRKMRIRLPEYKIGKSNGLRLLHLFIKDKGKVVPLVIYAKKSIGSEKTVRDLIVSALKEIVHEFGEV